MDSQFSHKKSGAGSTLGASSEWGGTAAFSSSPRPDMLRIRYVQASDFSQAFESDAPHILAVIGHGSGDFVSAIGEGLSIEVNLPQLFQPPFLEVWRSSAPVWCDQVQDIRLAFTDEVAFGCLEVPESSGSVLEDVARAAYERIINYCARSGYAHLLRMWNYFPGINQEQQGLERYRRFCMGRHQAFSTYQKEMAPILPAASAVGTHGGPFQVLFLAGKQPGRPLENPRQISAYEYPPIYGPKSPSFARATLHRTSTGCQLFVAGTASIVGHTTQHQGDPAKQTVETLSNIDALLNRVCCECPELLPAEPSEGLLKVFVRNQADLHSVREALEGHEYGRSPILYVRGEMCRKELLVEIEAMWNLPFPPND
jgi:chorismate lyase/3-hydroxybenzoate synthase